MAELLHCGIWAASLLARQYGTQATVSCQTGCSLLKALKLLPISLRYPQAPATFRPPHSHSLPQLHHSGFLAKVQSPHLRTSVLTVLTVWNTLTQKNTVPSRLCSKFTFSLTTRFKIPGPPWHYHIKRNTFESVLMRWMNLEPIIQSEVSQKEKDKYRILTDIWNLEKCYWRIYLQGSNG